MGKARRCLWLLTALMLICAAMPTLAASKGEGTQVYVYAYALKVYEKPSKKSDVIARVPFARSLWMVAEKKGWAESRPIISRRVVPELPASRMA